VKGAKRENQEIRAAMEFLLTVESYELEGRSHGFVTMASIVWI